jgi:flagellar motor switch protein FliM
MTVDLCAVLGKSHISIDDFIKLKVGDVIRLKTKTNSKIPVFVNKCQLFNAVPGRKGKNYAFKITSTVKGEEDHEN